MDECALPPEPAAQYWHEAIARGWRPEPGVTWRAEEMVRLARMRAAIETGRYAEDRFAYPGWAFLQWLVQRGSFADDGPPPEPATGAGRV